MIAVAAESGSGVASYYSESILIASVVVPSNSKSSKGTMSMNQYDEFIGVQSNFLTYTESSTASVNMSQCV